MAVVTQGSRKMFQKLLCCYGIGTFGAVSLKVCKAVQKKYNLSDFLINQQQMCAQKTQANKKKISWLEKDFEETKQ